VPSIRRPPRGLAPTYPPRSAHPRYLPHHSAGAQGAWIPSPPAMLSLHSTACFSPPGRHVRSKSSLHCPFSSARWGPYDLYPFHSISPSLSYLPDARAWGPEGAPERPQLLPVSARGSLGGGRSAPGERCPREPTAWTRLPGKTARATRGRGCGSLGDPTSRTRFPDERRRGRRSTVGTRRPLGFIGFFLLFNKSFLQTFCSYPFGLFRNSVLNFSAKSFNNFS
jgi:hypothetical protein